MIRTAKFWSFVLPLILIATSNLFAQSTGNVTGTVVDEQNQPVVGINIVIKGTTTGTATNNEGYFSLENIATGTQALLISGVGYSEQEKEVNVRAGRTINIEVRLSTSTIEMAEVRVVDSRDTFNARYQQSKSTETVNDETARSYNSTNAYDALRIVPGVSYINSGNRNGRPSRIRGASTWAIPDAIEQFPTVKEAGIGAEDGGLEADFGSSIPAIALQNISIQKGSLGVLYSGDADGGVIVNEIKQGQAGAPQGTLWLETNPITEQLVMGDFSGGSQKFDYYISGKLMSGNYSEYVDTFDRQLTKDKFYSGIAKLGYNPSDDLRLEFIGLRGQDRINYSQPRSDDPDTQMNESTELTPNRFETTNNNDFYGLTLKHALSDNISYETGYSYFYKKAYRFSLTENLAHRDRPEHTHTVFGNTYLNFSISDNIDYSAKAGVELYNHRQEENAQGGTKEQVFIDRSVFYANTFTVADQLYLNGGIRVLDAEDDYQNHTGIYYDAGLAYRIPGLDTKLRASYSTGYSRNKGFAYFFGPIADAGGVDITENRTYEAGIDQPFSFGGNSEGTLSLTFFRNLNENVPVFSGWGAGTVYYEEHETDGIEASVDYRVGSLGSVFGSFSYMDPVITATTHPEGIGVESTSVPIPQYSASLGFNANVTDKLLLTTIATYNDGQRNRQINLQTGEVTTTVHESYTRINVSAKYRWSDFVTTIARMENLLNQTDLGYSSQVFGPDQVQTTRTNATDPGRFVSLAVVLNF